MRHWARWTGICALSVAATAFAREPVDRPDVGVFLPSGEKRAEQVFAGIRDGLRMAGMEATTMERDSGGDESAARLALLGFKNDGVDVVFAVGDAAAVLAAGTLRRRSIIYAGVSEPVALGLAGTSNACGTAGGVTSRQILRLLPRAAPKARWLGVLAPDDDPTARALLDGARDAPAVVVRRIDKDTLPDPSGSAAGHAVVWIGPTVDARTTEEIAGHLAGSGVLLLGSNREQLDAGCALVLRSDPRILGMLAVVQARAVLRGAAPSELPIRRPVRRLVEANLDACHRLGVELPLSLLAAADHVSPAFTPGRR